MRAYSTKGVPESIGRLAEFPRGREPIPYGPGLPISQSVLLLLAGAADPSNGAHLVHLSRPDLFIIKRLPDSSGGWKLTDADSFLKIEAGLRRPAAPFRLFQAV